MKIRSKFSVFTALAVLVTVVTVAALAFFLQKRLIEKNMEEARAAQSASFGAVCRQAITVDNELFMVNFAKLLLESPGIVYAYFVDTEGRIRVHSDKSFFYKTLSEWEAARPAGVLEAAQPVTVRGEKVLGTAVIGFSEAYERPLLEAALKRTMAHMSVASAAVATVMLAAALIFAFVLTGPLKTLVSASEEVGKGNFKVQVNVKSRDELGELAKSFNGMTQQLAILDELKDEFISSVSHDLRSPLSAIKMYSNYMLFEDPEKDKVIPTHRNFLLTIMESATRLGVFVTNVLDAAKIKAGRAEYHAHPMTVKSSVGNIHTLFGILAEKKKIKLLIDLPEGIPNIVADPERFDHVIANLISNALKFTPPEGRITVGAREEAGGQRVKIFVEDTGKGIAAENLGKLFSRFGQVDVADQRAKRVTGTGLGLFIVKKTVEDMGGTVAVTSQVGKGTCFTVTMPGTREPAAGSGAAAGGGTRAA
jgi:signal transduction histidine kinase